MLEWQQYRQEVPRELKQSLGQSVVVQDSPGREKQGSPKTRVHLLGSQSPGRGTWPLPQIHIVWKNTLNSSLPQATPRTYKGRSRAAPGLSFAKLCGLEKEAILVVPCCHTATPLTCSTCPGTGSSPGLLQHIHFYPPESFPNDLQGPLQPLSDSLIPAPKWPARGTLSKGCLGFLHIPTYYFPLHVTWIEFCSVHAWILPARC